MSRNDQIKQERRRRQDFSGKRMRLTVNESALDRENFAYRWVVNDPERLYQLTATDDWDIVPDRDNAVVTNGSGTGAEAAHDGGMGATGRPVRQVLLRKPKALHEEDKAQLQRRIDEKEDSAAHGNVDGGLGDHKYAGGQTTITRGSRT